ncbi:Hsp70 family protein [Niallia sp. FSL W8-1348]|uniref:Hsp70 family protein n=1 Tax=Niallia sp. FSL W8-1348 TaxID=2954656 RepID=UPI0030FC08C9
MSTNCIGIDLGTTYSVVAIVDETGSTKVLKNSEGKTTTPSVIYFGEEKPIIGEEAKSEQAFGSSEIASFFKRVMGDSNFQYEFGDKVYDTIDLSSMILKKLKQDAEKEINAEVKDAVITVPAYFNNMQREATIKAGKLAGLNVLRIINEPTAAAIAYGLHSINRKKNIMVYDLGGGTFDVTIAEIDNQEITVLATNGDHSLGGKDWDDRLASYVCERFYEKQHLDPLEDAGALNEILVSCEKAKKNLTDLKKVNLSIFFEGKKDTYEITRSLFEELTLDLIERTWNLADLALAEGNLSWLDIHDVILVGGSTKMPMISAYIQSKIGKLPLKGVNVDEVVAYGAAIQAKMEIDKIQNKYQVSSSYKKVQDIMSHSLGMVSVSEDGSAYTNSIIIRRNLPIPIIQQRPFQLHTSDKRENQLEVYVTQGESNNPLENEILGKYVISGIKHNPKGISNINVSYSYDANGIVAVTAIQDNHESMLSIKKEPLPEDLSWMGGPVIQENIPVELSVVIALDLSGSMSGSPLREAKKAASNFIDQFDLAFTNLGIVGFADSVQIIQDLTNEESLLKNAISNIKIGPLGYSNSAEPFLLTLEMLNSRTDRENLFVIVLTDGMWGNTDIAIRNAEICKRANIEIIAIGFGDADQKFLSRLATTDENALFMNETQLISSFSKIAREIKEKSNRLMFNKK